MDGFTINSLSSTEFSFKPRATDSVVFRLGGRKKLEIIIEWRKLMTKLQVDYWNMKVNEAMAAENERSHKANEAISRDTLNETVTHNRNTEAETQRHDIAGELETARHNVSTEQITRDTLAETTRHDLETERNQRDITSENVRHDKATEEQAFKTYLADKQIREEQNSINREKMELDAEIRKAQNAINAESNTIKRQQMQNDFDKWNRELQQKYDQMHQQYELAIREQDVSKRNATLNAITNLINSSGKNAYYWSRTSKDNKQPVVIPSEED
jgi:alpha-glucosidase (family GH31 glycosyl hydrolase)